MHSKSFNKGCLLIGTVSVQKILFISDDIEIFTDLPTANYVCNLNEIIYVRRFFKYLYQTNKSAYTSFISIYVYVCWLFVGSFWPLRCLSRRPARNLIKSRRGISISFSIYTL